MEKLRTPTHQSYMCTTNLRRFGFRTMVLLFKKGVAAAPDEASSLTPAMRSCPSRAQKEHLAKKTRTRNKCQHACQLFGRTMRHWDLWCPFSIKTCIPCTRAHKHNKLLFTIKFPFPFHPISYKASPDPRPPVPLLVPPNRHAFAAGT